MAIRLVTYDVRDDDNRSDLLAAVKDYGSWARLSESSYAISTTKYASTVSDELQEHINKRTDRLYVITLSSPWAGFGLEKVNDWLSDHL